nr:immunoglobulin light chain junction region [Macaca mulatta]MOW57005.1 immunoglobulin light chain junction region [Macaca mulatta]MOW57737.1 immunoglobulin light chain junction region [Macaca mulatta]MOW59815.1 immunoglobulin light chain junction region [Macaca mulatta]MOW61277.1 immunoglobulin light chain junction region [Macaca mulatta]
DYYCSSYRSGITFLF